MNRKNLTPFKSFIWSPFQNTKTRANFGSRPFAYAEGQAHRNAADLCTDLAEEISANFEALPFAMASDSDNDAGTSIASDPGTHGPPCRIAAVATAQQRKPLFLLSGSTGAVKVHKST
jgi:hypothetical protein